jgi:ABC-type bacteriocin/lantibiotic exporter with double-glycine peptidase domain
MTDLISLPHYLQSADGLCLADCVRMVLAYWGSAVSEENVAELLGIALWGVHASAIRRLSHWGWDVDDGRGARVDLTQWLQRGIPVIVFVRTDFLEY